MGDKAKIILGVGNGLLGIGMTSTVVAVYMLFNGAVNQITTAVESAKETAIVIQETSESLTKKAKAFKESLPDVGDKAGEAFARGVKKADKLLDDGNDTNNGVRDRAKTYLQKFKPKQN